jgi:hypothetical protein
MPSTPGEESAAKMQGYEAAFMTTPLSPPQIQALTVLAEEASMGRAARKVTDAEV